MRYSVYQNETLVNHIESDEAFCQDYCAKRGYTYQEDPLPDSPQPEPEPTEVEQLRAQVADLQNQILTMRLGG